MVECIYDNENDPNPGYVVFGDLSITCGKDFVLAVQPMDDPAEAELEIAESVTVPASVYYTFKHEHVYKGEIVVTKAATLLEDGSQYRTCSFCGKKSEPEATKFEIYVSDSKNISASKYADNSNKDIAILKNAVDIRGDKSFAPTADDEDGNDLWFEYSFLYNDSLRYRDNPSNLAEMRLFAFRSISKASNYRGFYYLYFLNDKDKGPADGAFDTSNDCPWAGHIDFSTYYPGSDPGQNCALDLTSEGNTLNGKPIGRYIAGWGAGRDDAPYLWDSEYQTMGGWHRLGFHYHQEASIVNGEVRYEGYTELFIDGVKCWKVLTNMEGNYKDGKWKNTDWSLKGKNLLLWTATIDPEDDTKLVYTNNDDVRVGLRLDNLKSSSQSVYVAFDDVQWTCGDGFATSVVRVENPKPVKITLPDGKEYDGAMYFAKPGCEHVAEKEFTILKAATLLEDGTRAKYCAKCGERIGDVEVYEYEPEITVLTSTSKKNYNTVANFEDVLGDKHFYDGNDLFIEFSILWNETLVNNSIGNMTTGTCGSTYKSQVRTSWMALNSNGGGNGCDCQYAGGFEYCDLNKHDDEFPVAASMMGSSSAFDQFPNIAGADAENPEWGWHRVTMQIHQEVTNVDALIADTKPGETKALYKFSNTVYVDGVKLFEISYTGDGANGDGNDDTGKAYWGANMNQALFTAVSDGKGGIYYEDNLGRSAYVNIEAKAKSGDAPAYYVLGDVSFTAGTAPVQAVTKVASPAAANYEVATGVIVNAAMYYQAAE